MNPTRRTVVVLLPYRPPPPPSRGDDGGHDDNDVRVNRSLQLAAFLKHMRGPFAKSLALVADDIDLFFVVAEQTQDGRGFNRGALLNAAAILADRLAPTWLVLHDIDLLPDAKSPEIAKLYATPPLTAPIHLGALFARYAASNPNYYGGALAILPDHLRAANGFPNTFFGWGGEDDAFRARIARVGLLNPHCLGRALARDPNAPRLRDLEDAPSYQDKAVRLEHRDRCARKHELRERDTRANAWVLDGICNLQFQILRTLSPHPDTIHLHIELRGGGVAAAPSTPRLADTPFANDDMERNEKGASLLAETTNIIDADDGMVPMDVATTTTGIGRAYGKEEEEEEEEGSTTPDHAPPPEAFLL